MPTMAESTVPVATKAMASERSVRDRERSVRRSSSPQANRATTTAVAEASHDGSALIPMPSRSG